jgi:NADPH:quinone reductase-like Zn-dependent oxidoreductase
MNAMTQDRYGSADVLALKDITVPVVGDEDVLTRVRAAGVGPDVWHLMTGLPYMVRLMGNGLRQPKTRVPGWDVAGSVEAVGKDVTQLHPGDEVFGFCRGAFAEYACARADKVAPKPANLTFEQAAGVPVSASTALRGLRGAGGIQTGQTVLIIGASGGAGTFAVQLAKVFGAHVTGVCRHGEGGPRPVHRRRPRDRLHTRGLSPFVGQRLRALSSVERQEDLLFLKDVIEAGKVTPIISGTYPLDEAPKALSDADEGHGRGKAVITV